MNYVRQIELAQDIVQDFFINYWERETIVRQPLKNDSLYVMNASFSTFFTGLKMLFSKLADTNTLINETGISLNMAVDIRLVGGSDEIKELNVQLERYGLAIAFEKRQNR